MRRLGLASLLFLTTTLLTLPALADTPELAGEPIVAIGKLKSLDTFKENVDLVGDWIGQPELWKTLEAMASKNGEKPDLSIISFDEPIGFAATASNHFVALIPTPDTDAFIATMETLADEKKRLGKRTWQFVEKASAIGSQPKASFFQEHDGFVLAASDLKSLNSFDKELANELKSLRTPLLLTARIYLDGIPAPLRNMAYSRLENAMETEPALGKSSVGKKQAAASRIAQRKMVRKLAEGLDTITIVAGLDQEEDVLRLEFDYAGKSGSLLAQLPQYAGLQTRFAGFRGKKASASFELHAAASGPLALLFEDFRNNLPQNEQTKELEPQINAMLDEVARTIRAVGVDMVGSGDVVARNSKTMLLAMAVSDTSALERLVEDLIKKEGQDIKLTRSKLQDGTRCYEILRDKPLNQSDSHTMDFQTGVIAFAADAAYLAIGDHAKTDLVQAIADSKTPEEAPPFFNTHFTFAHSMKMLEREVFKQNGVENPWLSQMADENTEVGVSVMPTERGASLRLKIGGGVLKSIGSITTMGAKFNQQQRLPKQVPLSRTSH